MTQKYEITGFVSDISFAELAIQLKCMDEGQAYNVVKLKDKNPKRPLNKEIDKAIDEMKNE